MLQRVAYEDLNARQREIYNFQKIAAQLADYGYNCMRLSDDWEGADFIACHKDGMHFLKVQLKGRLGVYQKYSNKEIHMAFRFGQSYFVFPHDEFLDYMLAERNFVEQWETHGFRHWPQPPAWALEWLEPYRL